MDILYFLVIPAIMSVLSRMSGGGIGAKYLDKKGTGDGVMPFNLSFLPEVVFASCIGLASYSEYGIIAGTIGSAWSYIWMQTGHGTAYTMGRYPEMAQGGRKQTLSIIVDPICKMINAPLGGYIYCWIFMGIKGSLIGLPIMPYGLALAILWPLGYEIGWRIGKHTAGGEFITGLFTGLAMAFLLL